MSSKRKNRDTEVAPAPSDPPTDPHIPAAEPVPEFSDPEPATESTPIAAAPAIVEEVDEEEDAPSSKEEPTPGEGVSRDHLKGLCEALVFASDRPLKASEIARSAHAPTKLVKEILSELEGEYGTRGIHLGEIAGGWTFRTSTEYAPFVRDLSAQKPVRLTRAQVETLAIVAYRQPVTRPEIDDVRGVDSGPVLRMLLERDLVRILGKKDEPGRPILYGTGHAFLELFGLKSLKDLPTLREFTDLNEESRRVVERELGEAMETKVDMVDDGQQPAPFEAEEPTAEGAAHDEPPTEIAE